LGVKNWSKSGSLVDGDTQFACRLGGGVGGWLARRKRAGIITGMTGIDCIAALKALGELNRLRIVRLLLKEQLGVNPELLT
jgi:hypothetical protein